MKAKLILPNYQALWPVWAIYLTLGNFLKPLATINLSKSITFLGNFCKDAKIYHFSSEIIFGNFYRHLVCFFLVTLLPSYVCNNNIAEGCLSAANGNDRLDQSEEERLGIRQASYTEMGRDTQYLDETYLRLSINKQIDGQLT